MYGQAPANFRNSNTEILFFPRIEFNPAIKGMKGLKYRIVEMEEQTFYGKTTGLVEAKIGAKAIRDLYEKSKKDGTMDFILSHSNGKEIYYGLYYDIYKNGEYQNMAQYYVLGKTPRKDFIEVKIPKIKWACFSLPNHEQKDILKLCSSIFDKWLPDSDYYCISKYPELEIYYKDYCEICVAVE